jgi:hypothetical protein
MSLRLIARTLGALLMLVAVVLPAAGRAAPGNTALAVPVLSAAPPLDATLGGSWSAASQAALGWDFTYRREAGEGTTVQIGRYGGALYVAFDVTQRGTFTATQHTNGSGVDSDDVVRVDLWPSGQSGFHYVFEANPLGARYQTSTENAAYAPDWTAVGLPRQGGYTVVMRIPFAIIHGNRGSTWRAQFERVTVATGSTAAWIYDPAMTAVEDVQHSGLLTGIGDAQTAATRPLPRLGIYGLGQMGAPVANGSTSRVGADLSLPIAQTASLFATFHPDYSNVEIDQQTIMPSQFPRQYSEVRPFFTQAASFYNPFFCVSCDYQLLYTPAIPAPRDGYAFEGRSGEFASAGFESIGDDRIDRSAVASYSDPIGAMHVSVQNVDVRTPNFIDNVTELGTSYTNPKSHVSLFANNAEETGTFVADPARAVYSDVGVGIANATSSFYAILRRLGPQFAPVDGYVQQPDVAGYAVNGSTTRNLTSGMFRSVSLSVYADRYHGSDGGTNQADSGAQLSTTLRDNISFNAFLNASAARATDGSFLPFDQNGASLGYLTSTSTPSLIAYEGGAYGRGRLASWQRQLTFLVRRRLMLNLEADDDRYTPRLATDTPATLWLERAGATVQLTRDASFSLGLRRILGAEPPTTFAPLVQPPVSAGNVTAAFHLLRGSNELFVVYGDANTLSTTPALIVRLTHYLGAGKGS